MAQSRRSHPYDPFLTLLGSTKLPSFASSFRSHHDNDENNNNNNNNTPNHRRRNHRNNRPMGYHSLYKEATEIDL